MSTILHPETNPRQTWLAPPGATVRLDARRVASARRALTIARKAAASADADRVRRVLLAEAQASSYIEGIDDDTTTAGNRGNYLNLALEAATKSSDPADLLSWHRTLMTGHPDPRMRPGQYRNLPVRVGRWLPPDHSELAERMQTFLQWMSQEPEPLMRAIWGHRYFETIHPFADGNGRVGRLLIVQALGTPVIISRNLWWNRSHYMALLDDSDWTAWSQWMLAQIQDAAYRTARDLSKTWHYLDDLAAITAMNQPPLPKLPDLSTATIPELLAYERAVRDREPRTTP